MKILGVIITYNPDIKRLNKNIAAVIRQVDELLIVDNNSVNIQEIRDISKEEKIALKELNCNMGIAFALSNGLDYAKNQDYDYIFTLDQDSICDKNIINKLCEGFNAFENVAISSPELVSIEKLGENQGNEDEMINSEITIVERCVTSGSLCSVKKLIDAGGFNNELFIDEVDHELCYRLLYYGYVVVKNKYAILFHEIGSPQKRRFFNKNIIVPNHNAFRQYYKARNGIYISKEFENLEHVRQRKIKFELLKHCVKIALYEKHKIDKIHAIIKGIIDGRNFTTKMSRKIKS